ncbi:hypothetical protein GJV44_00910 [Candidatus Vallotia cooleyia]|nr:hypothetical protein GJV44_00910 [Candidatus Vallotia cooleyia]
MNQPCKGGACSLLRSTFPILVKKPLAIERVAQH